MNIAIKNYNNSLIISKNSNKELKKLRKTSISIFLFLNCFNIYFFIDLYLKGDKIGALVTIILGGIICYIPIGGIYN